MAPSAMHCFDLPGQSSMMWGTGLQGEPLDAPVRSQSAIYVYFLPTR